MTSSMAKKKEKDLQEWYFSVGFVDTQSLTWHTLLILYFLLCRLGLCWYKSRLNSNMPVLIQLVKPQESEAAKVFISEESKYTEETERRWVFVLRTGDKFSFHPSRGDPQQSRGGQRVLMKYDEVKPKFSPLHWRDPIHVPLSGWN